MFRSSGNRHVEVKRGRSGSSRRISASIADRGCNADKRDFFEAPEVGMTEAARDFAELTRAPGLATAE